MRALMGIGLVLTLAACHIVVLVHGCDGKRAAGVSLEAEAAAGSTVAYWKGGAISKDATETDPLGIAYVLNAPPGVLSISSKRAATGQVFGKARVQTRAATSTELFMRATP